MPALSSLTSLFKAQRPVSVVDPLTFTADQYEAWFMDLPPLVRGKLGQQIELIVAGLPPDDRFRLSKLLSALNRGNPLPSNLGLGQWGAVITGIAQIGAGMWSGHEQMNLQEQLAAQQLTAQGQQSQAAIEASTRLQMALIDAQKEAQRLAAEQSAGTSQALISTLKPVAIAAGIALVVGTVIYLRKRSKKARP